MRLRSSWLPRPLVVDVPRRRALDAVGGLPVVHATIPYYPYECPIGSGGRDFDGNGNEGNRACASWDPRTGLWWTSNQAGTPIFGYVGGHPGAGRLQW